MVPPAQKREISVILAGLGKQLSQSQFTAQCFCLFVHVCSLLEVLSAGERIAKVETRHSKCGPFSEPFEERIGLLVAHQRTGIILPSIMQDPQIRVQPRDARIIVELFKLSVCLLSLLERLFMHAGHG